MIFVLNVSSTSFRISGVNDLNDEIYLEESGLSPRVGVRTTQLRPLVCVKRFSDSSICSGRRTSRGPGSTIWRPSQRMSPICWGSRQLALVRGREGREGERDGKLTSTWRNRRDI